MQRNIFTSSWNVSDIKWNPASRMIHGLKTEIQCFYVPLLMMEERAVLLERAVVEEITEYLFHLCVLKRTVNISSLSNTSRLCRLFCNVPVTFLITCLYKY